MSMPGKQNERGVGEVMEESGKAPADKPLNDQGTPSQEDQQK